MCGNLANRRLRRGSPETSAVCAFPHTKESASTRQAFDDRQRFGALNLSLKRTSRTQVRLRGKAMDAISARFQVVIYKDVFVLCDDGSGTEKDYQRLEAMVMEQAKSYPDRARLHLHHPGERHAASSEGARRSSVTLPRSDSADPQQLRVGRGRIGVPAPPLAAARSSASSSSAESPTRRTSRRTYAQRDAAWVITHLAGGVVVAGGPGGGDVHRSRAPADGAIDPRGVGGDAVVFQSSTRRRCWKRAGGSSMRSLLARYRHVAFVIAGAGVVSAASAHRLGDGGDRSASLVKTLGERGLVATNDDVRWIDAPNRIYGGTVRAIVRAAAKGEAGRSLLGPRARLARGRAPRGRRRLRCYRDPERRREPTDRARPARRLRREAAHRRRQADGARPRSRGAGIRGRRLDVARAPAERDHQPPAGRGSARPRPPRSHSRSSSTVKAR